MSDIGTPTMSGAEISDWETKVRAGHFRSEAVRGNTIVLFRYISDYIASHEYGPTLREMADALDTSFSTANYHLLKLREFGLVDWTPGAARTVRVTGVLS